MLLLHLAQLEFELFILIDLLEVALVHFRQLFRYFLMLLLHSDKSFFPLLGILVFLFFELPGFFFNSLLFRF